MEGKTLKETDIATIKSLIAENTDIARELRGKAEHLHVPTKPDIGKQAAGAEVVLVVGKELIDSLQIMRVILRDTRDALAGFNG